MVYENLGHFPLEFFIKFRLKTLKDIFQDAFWSMLKFVNFWQLRGYLSTFQKWVPSENKIFLDEGVTNLPYIYLVSGVQITRLYDGTILGGG